MNALFSGSTYCRINHSFMCRVTAHKLDNFSENGPGTSSAVQDISSRSKLMQTFRLFLSVSLLLEVRLIIC